MDNSTLDIDFRDELEVFSWNRPNWRTDKLIAASPFRYDRTPSFFVSLEHGGWKDSGASDPEWSSGNFVKLLAFLRNETYEETREYLEIKYMSVPKDIISIDMAKSKMRLNSLKQKPFLNVKLLTSFKFRHPYLERRGISEEIQRVMRIGYDKRSKAVTIPWFTADEQLANVKYRRTDSKVFWYHGGGAPIRSQIYGIDVIYRNKHERAVIVESETDALYLMTAGIPAIAVGGSAFSPEQAELIAKSPIERLDICTDNDAAGLKLRDIVEKTLRGRVDIGHIRLPAEYKDANDVKSLVELRKYCDATSVQKIVINL